MKLAAAQIGTVTQDIEANLEKHYHLIEQAANNQADLILFPELSITGYERKNAREFAFSPDDERLRKLKEFAVRKQIIIIAGAPVNIRSEIFIGAFILLPDGSINIYTKQFLHAGEEQFYRSSFDFNPLIQFQQEKLSLAICSDINHSAHPAFAQSNGVSLYLAGIFFERDEMKKAHTILAGYARKYSMRVLMSNYCGSIWGLQAGGGSAFWDSEGHCIASLNDSDPGILLIQDKNVSSIQAFSIIQ
ncbi:MAG: carbon-nitrogen hydrolase family protein [Saprospiraceae bacterium]|nr:carbon-nitrogen hydrolase family protein [Saprospiraceae bacterium]